MSKLVVTVGSSNQTFAIVTKSGKKLGYSSSKSMQYVLLLWREAVMPRRSRRTPIRGPFTCAAQSSCSESWLRLTIVRRIGSTKASKLRGWSSGVEEKSRRVRVAWKVVLCLWLPATERNGKLAEVWWVKSVLIVSRVRRSLLLE